jgi:pimeloyl-ACP methyl ester carboxylesterase
VWITAGGFTFHTRVPAHPVPTEEPVLVLVHGLVVSSRYMVPTARELLPYYRVYLPDLPGFGKSSKPRHVLTLPEQADALAMWMRTMKLKRAVLVGNSLGCQVIAHLAIRHPELVERAVLVGPTMDPQARTAHQKSIRWLLNIPHEPISLFLIVARDYLDAGFRRFIRTFSYGLQDRIEEHLPAVQVPTLVVRGSYDVLVPQRWAEEATRLLSQGRLVVIRGAGHDVNYNSPQELAEAIRTFLDETMAGTSPATTSHQTTSPQVHQPGRRELPS